LPQNTDILSALRNLTEKLDILLSYMKDNGDFEKRVRSLEDWKSNIQGRVVMLVIIGGALWTLAVAAIITMIKR
jgi:hypothetical protein